MTKTYSIPNLENQWEAAAVFNGCRSQEMGNSIFFIGLYHMYAINQNQYGFQRLDMLEHRWNSFQKSQTIYQT